MCSNCFSKVDSIWSKNDDWKTRYKNFYSSRYQRPREEPQRISFMSNDSTPYTTLLMKLRASQCDGNLATPLRSPFPEGSQSDYRQDSLSRSSDINDTVLLDMVCSHNRELADELHDVPELPRVDDLENQSQECYPYGTSMRTECSVSRSRVSRMSTRRDMDIPSILAFTASVTTPVHLAHPAFQKIENQETAAPRWSIRRSVCPVCSQKWRDRSSILNIKNSGLKRNSSAELPSIIAPARLRSSITMGYKPPSITPAIEKHSSVLKGGVKSANTSWQLTRARRLRMPKPLVPSPDVNAPPSCSAPMAIKDLDSRISKFLTDDF